MPTRPAITIVPVVDDEPGAGQVEAEPGQQGLEPGGQAEPDREADRRGDDADDERLDGRPPRRTWRREAPMARSRADSRLRWATRIENVLWMLNVATTRAIAGEGQQERLEHAEEVALDVLLLLGGQLGCR